MVILTFFFRYANHNISLCRKMTHIFISIPLRKHSNAAFQTVFAMMN